MNKHKNSQEKSSSRSAWNRNPTNKPVTVQQSKKSMVLIPEKHCLSNDKALWIAQWLAKVELGEQDVPYPSLSLKSDAEPLTTSAVPDQHATTGLARSSPTQKFVHKNRGRGGMRGMDGSGGRVPATTVSTRPPVPPPPSPSSSLQGAGEHDQTRVQSRGQAALQKADADAQSTTKTRAESTFPADEKTRR